MAYKLAPIFNDAQQINSIAANGGLLFTYVAGSVNTKQTTYTDITGTVPQANPIVLNSRGEPSSPIWLTAGQAYKFVFAPSTDTDPPTSPIRTIDNIAGINDASISIDQWVSSGVTPTYVSASSFTLAGDQTTNFQVGRRLKLTVTAGTVYGTIATSVFGALTTIGVTLDSGALDAGLSAVSYGLLTNTNQSLPAAYNTLSSINGGQLAGFRNALINANFSINRRVVSGTVTLGAGVYGHDRWKAGAGGCTYTFATVNNVTTLTISAGTLQQVIEGNNLQSGNYKLSWVGTATARVDTGGYGASGVVGTAVGGTNQTVEFATGTVSKVMYEFGSVATVFEQRPIGLELALCQRYLPVISAVNGNVFAVGQVLSATTASVMMPLPITARVPPTGITSSGSSVVTNSTGGAVAVSGFAFSSSNNSSLTVVVTVGAGLTAGNATLSVASAGDALILCTGCEL
jgi:hypothetical protein